MARLKEVSLMCLLLSRQSTAWMDTWLRSRPLLNSSNLYYLEKTDMLLWTRLIRRESLDNTDGAWFVNWVSKTKFLPGFTHLENRWLAMAVSHNILFPTEKH